MLIFASTVVYAEITGTGSGNTLKQAGDSIELNLKTVKASTTTCYQTVGYHVKMTISGVEYETIVQFSDSGATGEYSQYINFTDKSDPNSILNRLIVQYPGKTDVFVNWFGAAGQKSITLNAIMAVSDNGVVSGGVDDQGRIYGTVYDTESKIANARNWSSATKSSFKQYFNRSMTFSQQDISEWIPEPSISPLIQLSEGAYTGVGGFYYINKINNVKKGETFSVINNTKIDGKPYQDWVLGENGNAVNFVWSCSPTNLLNTSSLGMVGGQATCLTAGKGTLNLTANATKNGKTYSKQGFADILIVEETDPDTATPTTNSQPVAILDVPENTDKATIFKADASASKATTGTMIVDYKWFIDGVEKPEYKGKKTIDVTATTNATMNIKVIVTDNNNKTDDETKTVSLKPKIPAVATVAKIKLIPVGSGYEGYTVFHARNVSLIDGQDWGTWLYNHPEFDLLYDWDLSNLEYCKTFKILDRDKYGLTFRVDEIDLANNTDRAGKFKVDLEVELVAK